MCRPRKRGADTGPLPSHATLNRHPEPPFADTATMKADVSLRAPATHKVRQACRLSTSRNEVADFAFRVRLRICIARPAQLASPCFQGSAELFVG